MSLAASAVVLQGTVARSAQAQAMSPEPMRTTSMMLDRRTRTFFLADVLDFQPNGSERPVTFEGLGWIGGDYHRVYLRAVGERPTTGGGGDLQADLLYGRLVSPFWTAVAGVRVDTRPGRRSAATGAGGGRATRGLLAVGLEGIAPYWFQMEPTLYVSQHGDVSARLETSFDLLLTQRLIVQPRVELDGAVQRVPEFGVGAGLNDVQLGARMRYEIRRKFAPYVGVSWSRRTGGTAAMARANGEPVRRGAVVLGVRVWR
ncbi:MAG TPA: copper resistance protein B [Gemmatimonadaceae bacterium]|nr:copper resistance protein B [Gemmatimonadaceae bacterium]